MKRWEESSYFISSSANEHEPFYNSPQMYWTSQPPQKSWFGQDPIGAVCRSLYSHHSSIFCTMTCQLSLRWLHPCMRLCIANGNGKFPIKFTVPNLCAACQKVWVPACNPPNQMMNGCQTLSLSPIFHGEEEVLLAGTFPWTKFFWANFIYSERQTIRISGKLSGSINLTHL